MLSISKKVALYLLALSWMLAGSAEAQSTSPDVSDLIVPRGPVAASVDARLARTTGEVEIVIRLTDVPLVVAHGKNAKKLTQLGGYNTFAIWSADGKSIVFQHLPDYEDGPVFIMDADGGNRRVLRQNEVLVKGARPAWRPK